MIRGGCAGISVTLTEKMSSALQIPDSQVDEHVNITVAYPDLRGISDIVVPSNSTPTLSTWGFVLVASYVIASPSGSKHWGNNPPPVRSCDVP
jgi:hypothetical protein